MRMFFCLSLSTYPMETNIANMNGKHEDNVSHTTVRRHIVVSGGGPSLFTIFGALKCLVDKELIDPDLLKASTLALQEPLLGFAYALQS